eukprot:g5890.t1
MYEQICKEWQKDTPGIGKPPGPPPTKKAVKRVQKRDWSHVKEMRVGEYGICGPCRELMQQRDQGFTGKRDADDWKARNDLHHEIHQICHKKSSELHCTSRSCIPVDLLHHHRHVEAVFHTICPPYS